MPKEAISILVHDYKVRFGGHGEKPHVIITLNKNEPQNIKLLIAEFTLGMANGQTTTKIAFSTDGLLTDSVEKLSVVVSIQCDATEYQKRSLNITGDAMAVCCISSQHPANLVRALYQSCQRMIQAESKIPVIITNHKEKAICVLAASKVSEFSWKDHWREMELARHTGNETIN